jgi:hypothetical protein
MSLGAASPVIARRAAAAILIAGFGAMLAMNAPGQMSTDSVAQLADGRSGLYNSWHPPVMAFLLGLFDAVVPGTLLFLIFQGLLLLAGLLALLGLSLRGWASAWVAAAIVLTPQWLLYQGEIWKDVLFSNAAIAGFAALAVFASRGRMAWLVLSGLLLTLAAATRQNGGVLLPAAAAALAWIARRAGKSGWAYGLGFLVVTLGLGAGVSLALTYRGDGGDGASAEIRMGQSYDLAGAVSRDPTLPLPSLTVADPRLEMLLRQRGAALYTPLRNDPFAADPAISQALSDAPDGAVADAWRTLVLGHPLLYARTRLATFDAVLRTPDSIACHFWYSGINGSPKLLRQLGLTARIRLQDWALADYARIFRATPVYSHLAWGALALILLVLLLRRGEPADLAVAGLLGGALLFVLTFAVISIACDYRYLVFLDLSAMAAALYSIRKA